MAKRKAPHHSGSYQVRARAVRDAANANPNTRCWRCDRTKAEHRREWTAGHVTAGDPNSALLPECARCNYSHGAKLGNRRRKGLAQTRDW